MSSIKCKVKFLKFTGLLFIILFALLYSHDEVGMSGNESGRFATIQAIAEQGVFHIETCNFRTVDRTIRNNHIYYDKLPFLPFVLAGVYYPLHRFCGLNFVDNYHFSIYLINVLLGIGVNSLLFLWLFNLLRSVKKGSIEWKFFLSISCVAGTWLLSYSTMLNNHTPAALAVLGLLIALKHYSRVPHWQSAMLAGAAAGISGLLELPCGAFSGSAAVAAVLFCAPAEKRLSHAAATAGTGALLLLAGVLLNLHAYGTWLPLYFGSHGVKGTFGVDSNSNIFYYCYHIFIGDRGIFSHMPFLLLGFWALFTSKFKWHRIEYIFASGIAAYMLFYLTCTNEFGGQSYGFRYFIPIIPVIWFWGARFVLTLTSCKWKVPVLAIIILWGIITALAGAYFPFCPGNEGDRTHKANFTRYVSSFGGNLLCWSYENHPQSMLTAELINRYGLKHSLSFMYWSYFQRKKIDMLARMQRDFPEYFPGGKK